MKNVVINDWWDRSPCTWICDLDKLDENDPIQLQYKQLILGALETCEVEPNKSEPPWYFSGQNDINDKDVEGYGDREREWNGRPDEVRHAVAFPPCEILGIVNLWYGF